MKKIVILLFIIMFFSANNLFSQTPIIRTLNWDGIDREFTEIAPNDQTTAKPVLFFLNGIGGTMGQVTSMFSADVADWFYIIPEATEWKITNPMTVNMGNTWNVGAKVQVLGFEIALNPDVDDSGFLMAILDSLENNYNIDTDSIFFCGFSLGGFMANRMAIEYSDRITGIASVSGTIPNEFVSQNPTQNILALHIHGTADNTVKYNNGNVNIYAPGAGNINSTFGIGAEETVEYWRNFNACNETPIIYHYPIENETKNNITFDRYYYLNGENNSRVALITANNLGHDWCISEYGIDYQTEIIKFFRGLWSIPEEAYSIKNNINQSIGIYPNPTSGQIIVKTLRTSSPQDDASSLQIYDITGRIVQTQLIVYQRNTNTNELTIDISHLQNGIYFLQINNEIFKIIKN